MATKSSSRRSNLAAVLGKKSSPKKPVSDTQASKSPDIEMSRNLDVEASVVQDAPEPSSAVPEALPARKRARLGRPPKAGERAQMSIHIAPELRDRFKVRAAQEKRTMGDIASDLLTAYLRRRREGDEQPKRQPKPSERTPLTLRVDPSIRQKLRLQAVKEEREMSEVMADLIHEWLAVSAQD